MTKIDMDFARCAICGQSSKQPTETLEAEPSPPDFDTRPATVDSNTLYSWLQQCPWCGYAAEKINKSEGEVARVVRGDEYQGIRRDDQAPPAARKFLCHGFLVEQTGLDADAGWSALQAAWLCDDAGEDEAARRCRGLAIELWRRGKAAGQDFCGTALEEYALVADLYRRMGDFETAMGTCLEALQFHEVPAVIEDILRAQMTLIQRQDAGRHSTEELRRPPEGAERVVWE